MNYFPREFRSVLFAFALCGAFATSLASAAPATTLQVGTAVTATQLESLLKSGPHALIRAFLVEPAYAGKRFIGFRVVQRTPHPVLSIDAPVKVGDVIVSANGVRLETPGQFMAAWGKLRSTKVFSVMVIRDQKKLSMNWHLENTELP
jgi:S1-C subfamily serine protease